MNNDIILKNNRNEVLTKQDVVNALESGAIELGYTDLMDLKQNGSSSDFGICCEYVGRMFNDRRLLWNDANYKAGNGNGINKDLLLSALDIYIFYSTIYDKRICKEYFIKFCGISGSYLSYSQRVLYMNDSTFNSIYLQLLKRITDADNELQLNKARDSKQSILNLAYNNYQHGWSGQIKEKELTTAVKTLEDIRRERLEKYADDVQSE